MTKNQVQYCARMVRKEEAPFNEVVFVFLYFIVPCSLFSPLFPFLFFLHFCVSRSHQGLNNFIFQIRAENIIDISLIRDGVMFLSLTLAKPETLELLREVDEVHFFCFLKTK